MNSYDQRMSLDTLHILREIRDRLETNNFQILKTNALLTTIAEHQKELINMAKATTTNTSIGYSEEIGDEDLYASRGNKVEISQSQSRQSKGVGPKAPRPGCGKGGK